MQFLKQLEFQQLSMRQFLFPTLGQHFLVELVHVVIVCSMEVTHLCILEFRQSLFADFSLLPSTCFSCICNSTILPAICKWNSFSSILSLHTKRLLSVSGYGWESWITCYLKIITDGSKNDLALLTDRGVFLCWSNYLTTATACKVGYNYTELEIPNNEVIFHLYRSNYARMAMFVSALLQCTIPDVPF